MTLPGVSKTALLTLRARAFEHTRPRGVLEDPLAVDWSRRAGWDQRLDAWAAQPLSMSLIAFRAHEIDQYVRAHLDRVAAPVVVELGCGFSTRYTRVGGERAALWLEVDLPELIAVRDELLPPASPRQTLGGSALEDEWLERLRGHAPEDVLLVAEGLLYYLPEASVMRWFAHLREQLPGAVCVFDLVGSQDFANLLANTERVGAPAQWRLGVPFDEALAHLGLEPVPEASSKDSLDRWVREYWPSLGFWAGLIARAAVRSAALRAHRSGTLVGRLPRAG